MRFNWIVALDTSDEVKKGYLEMEYRLRQRISKFLISNWDHLIDDFDRLVFDIDLATKEITISNQSPIYLKAVIEQDFYKEFDAHLPPDIS